MKRLEYIKIIPASAAHVWEAFVGKDTYPQWTEAFVPGAYYTGEWKTGATVMAVSPNPDGSEDGLYSTIVCTEYGQRIEVEHKGVMRNGVLHEDGIEALDWKGGKEEYTFTDVPGGTQLEVMMDVHEDWAEHFQNSWPVALQRLEEIATTGESASITVFTWITASIEQVWKCYTDPKHVKEWNAALMNIAIDLREGGVYTALAQTSLGTITRCVAPLLLSYQLDNSQKVDVLLAQEEEYVAVRIRLDRTKESTRQQQGEQWQQVLHALKAYVESQELL